MVNVCHLPALWNGSDTQHRGYSHTFLYPVGFLLTSGARTVLPGMPGAWAALLSFMQLSNLVVFCLLILDRNTNLPLPNPK